MFSTVPSHIGTSKAEHDFAIGTTGRVFWFIESHINGHARCQLQFGTKSQSVFISATVQSPMIGFSIDASPARIFKGFSIGHGIAIGNTFQCTIDHMFITHTTIIVETELAFTRKILKTGTHASMLALETVVIKQVRAMQMMVITADVAIAKTAVKGRTNVRSACHGTLGKPNLAGLVVIMAYGLHRFCAVEGLPILLKAKRHGGSFHPCFTIGMHIIVDIGHSHCIDSGIHRINIRIPRRFTLCCIHYQRSAFTNLMVRQIGRRNMKFLSIHLSIFRRWRRITGPHSRSQ